jgi:hypothetical protein
MYLVVWIDLSEAVSGEMVSRAGIPVIEKELNRTQVSLMCEHVLFLSTTCRYE